MTTNSFPCNVTNVLFVAKPSNRDFCEAAPSCTIYADITQCRHHSHLLLQYFTMHVMLGHWNYCSLVLCTDIFWKILANALQKHNETPVLIHVVQSSCLQPVNVNLIGSNITDIPRSLSPNVTHLRIYNTGISILNLTMAVNYHAMCSMHVISSLITDIVTPATSQSTSLAIISLKWSGRFSKPPNLGSLLAGQLLS